MGRVRDLQATSQLYKKQCMADFPGLLVSRMPPGKNMDDWFTIFRSGMWRLWWKLTKEGKKRYFEEFLEVLHQTKYVKCHANFYPVSSPVLGYVSAGAFFKTRNVYAKSSFGDTTPLLEHQLYYLKSWELLLTDFFFCLQSKCNG